MKEINAKGFGDGGVISRHDNKGAGVVAKEGVVALQACDDERGRCNRSCGRHANTHSEKETGKGLQLDRLA